MANNTDVKQWVKVVDLNKCLGCQACTVSCKMWWTNREGAQHMWWSIVESRPGPGYPKEWEKTTARSSFPEPDDYEQVPEYSFKQLQDNMGNKEPRILPNNNSDYGPNWYEDVGEGTKPGDTWYYYLHMGCMHCTYPACVEACPSHAIYKRDDGIVLINQELCKGFKACIEACPYKRIFWNDQLRVAEKCIMCYPLIEQGHPPVCVTSCAGRAIFFGNIKDSNTMVSKLVNKYKVALPLHPEYKTEPNIYYIPPIFTASKGGTDSKAEDTIRIPEKHLIEMFGPQVTEAISILKAERQKTINGQHSELMTILSTYPTYEL